MIYADRIFGVISVFYFALLTERAFTLTATFEGLQPFEAAYAAPHINWTTSSEHLTLYPWNVADNEDGPQPLEGRDFQIFNAINPEYRSEDGPKKLIEMFESGNLTQLANDKDVIFMASNRGTSVRLFDNHNHADQLRSMGLTPETAFGCAVDFLFHPKPEVIELIEPEIEILKKSENLSIGIHIRLGDHILHGKDDTDVHAPNIINFFECAQQIEQFVLRVTSNKSVVWLLVSDSEQLRKHAKKIYGSKLITRLHRKIEHSFGHQYTNTKAETSLEGFLEAVGEQWLLSLTDMHVVDRQSGYGTLAAYRNFQYGAIFLIDSGHPDTRPQCRKEDSVTIKIAGYTRTGIKK